MKKINKIKSILCILLSLALVSPQYASSKDNSKKNYTLIDSASLFFTGLVMNLIGLYSVPYRHASGKQVFAKIKYRVLTSGGSALMLMGLLSSFVYSAELEDGSIIGYYSDLASKMQLKKEGLAVGFEGDNKNERELELKGKSLEDKYKDVDETCFYSPALAVDLPKITLGPKGPSIDNSAENKLKQLVVNTYIEKGCPSKFFKARTGYEVTSLTHNAVISEQSADRAREQLKNFGNNGSIGVVIHSISTSENLAN